MHHQKDPFKGSFHLFPTVNQVPCNVRHIPPHVLRNVTHSNDLHRHLTGDAICYCKACYTTDHNISNQITLRYYTPKRYTTGITTVNPITLQISPATTSTLQIKQHWKPIHITAALTTIWSSELSPLLDQPENRHQANKKLWNLYPNQHCVTSQKMATLANSLTHKSKSARNIGLQINTVQEKSRLYQLCPKPLVFALHSDFHCPWTQAPRQWTSTKRKISMNSKLWAYMECWESQFDCWQVEYLVQVGRSSRHVHKDATENYPVTELP